jgi:pimeloyl-ACP methyl ester carboxylesterase
MRRVKRVALGVLASTIALILLWWFWPAYTPRIPGGIASLESVTLGGVPQWVLIRGRNARAPILLFLHGGPGMPAMYLAHAFQRPLEEDFVVVHWDRRGAGKSFGSQIPKDSMRVTQELSDIDELIDALCERFHQDKIWLVGHSYGSYLGVLAARRYPARLFGFVGVGQVAGSPDHEHKIQDRWLEERGRADGNQELLASVGTSGFDRERWLFYYGGEIWRERSFLPLLLLGLRAPEYTARDALNVKRGVEFTGRSLKWDEIDGELMEAVPELHVPVYFFTGRHDYTCPFELAETYWARLRAPHKELVWFENSAHFSFLEEPTRFAAEMRRLLKAPIIRLSEEGCDSSPRGPRPLLDRSYFGICSSVTPSPRRIAARAACIRSRNSG